MEIFRYHIHVYPNYSLKPVWLKINLKREKERLKKNFGELNESNVKEYIKELKERLKREKIVGTIYGLYKLKRG